MKIDYSRPDLTQHPPRSPRVRIGGYALLARCIDKGRAEIAGKNGDYHFNCPLDQRFFSFAGLDAEAFKREIAAGKGDGDLLAWIMSNRRNKHELHEIQAWSLFQDERVPSSNELREFLSGIVEGAGGKARGDVGTWSEALDLDDYASFGGKA